MSKNIALTADRAIQIFTEGAMDSVLHEIEEEVLGFIPDLSTVTSRKEIASLAMKVSKSKVVIDKAGKELTAEWKSKAKLVDSSRKEARDFLDMLRDRVRKPLTEWETEKKAKEEQELLNKELSEAFIDAIAMNDLFNRERDLAERERLILEAQENERQRIATERAEIKRVEREKKIKEDAIIEGKLKAEREAKQAIEDAKLAEARAIEKQEQLKQRAVEIAQKAEEERIEAKRVAEQDKIDAINATALNALKKAEQEKFRAVAEQEARDDADKKRAENLEHRRFVNHKALSDLTENGVNESDAKIFIKLIASGMVTGITINY